jgi:hypothetical protein
MVMALAFLISLLARHLTQYACIGSPPFEYEQQSIPACNVNSQSTPPGKNIFLGIHIKVTIAWIVQP